MTSRPPPHDRPERPPQPVVNHECQIHPQGQVPAPLLTEQQNTRPVTLQQTRLHCGLTLKTAAAALKVSVLHLSNLERGKVTPDAELQNALATLYRRPTLSEQPATARPGPSGASPEEHARLTRLEFRRHRPLEDDETVRMLRVLSQLQNDTEHTEAAAFCRCTPTEPADRSCSSCIHRPQGTDTERTHQTDAQSENDSRSTAKH